MEQLLEILNSVEFWMGLSLVAAAFPGPQTRVLPRFFKAIAGMLAGNNKNQG
jgi:hypothetical protein